MKNCPCCDSENISMKYGHDTFTYLGNKVEIMALIFTCKKCGESFLSKASDKRLGERLRRKK
jgi:YgiT-type zinc finger domain-containing protein